MNPGQLFKRHPKETSVYCRKLSELAIVKHILIGFDDIWQHMTALFKFMPLAILKSPQEMYSLTRGVL